MLPVAGVMLIGCGLLVLSIFITSLRKRHLSASSSSSNNNNNVKKQVTGPKQWPVVGSLPYLDRNFPHHTFERWSQLYGHVYRVNVPGERWLIVSSYEAIREVLIEKGHQFAGRTPTYRLTLLTANEDIGMGNPSQAWWSPLKKTAMRGIHSIAMGHSLREAERALTKEMISRFQGHQGRPVDVRDDVYNITLKAIYMLLTGSMLEDGDPMFGKVKRLERIIMAGIGMGEGCELDAFPWLRFFGNKTYKRLKEALVMKEDIWQAVRGLHLPSHCLVSTMAGLRQPTSDHFNSHVLDHHLKEAFIDMLIAGVSTLTSSVYALINILHHNPEVLHCLQAECDVVVGRDRLPEPGDSARMPYTVATIRELLRYTSIVTIHPHSPIEDTTVAGCEVSRDTIVFPLFWAMHHDEAFWGDPWKFRPNRFLDDQGALLPPSHPVNRHLMPFGAGPRVCAGETFALKRLFLFAASIAQSFDLHPGSSVVTCDPRSYLDGFVLSPPDYTITMVTRHAKP